MTAYLETDSGILAPSNVRPLNESVRYDLTVSLLESRIGQLELQLQEQGWMRLGDLGGAEFGRDTIGRIAELARVNYLKNPLIRRAVEVGALYVWGQDLSINAADDQVKEVVDRFWEENRSVFTGQQASRLLEVELEVTGNVFLALFTDAMSGAVRVRPVPLEEIRGIVCDPEDRASVWFYKREWEEQPLDGGAPVKRTALYPDWRYKPDERPTSIKDIEVRWDSPILHVKAGAFPHWRWGVSEVYAALDWARAYKELLEDDATRSRALAKFAWKLTTGGGRQGVQQAKAKIGTTVGASDRSETNPPPTTGATFIAGEGTGLDPIRIAGANLDPDHSRPVRLMAASALGLPETFFGDADVGNHATAKTLDRPTELRYNERRQMWRDVFTDLCQWVIDRDIAAPGGILKFTPVGEAREVALSWPDLLERSITERVDAVVKAATLGGTTLTGTLPEDLVSTLLMSALSVEDIDGELAKLEDERAERDARREQLQRQMQPRSPGEPPAGDEQDTEREAFVAALREVREALRR